MLTPTTDDLAADRAVMDGAEDRRVRIIRDAIAEIRPGLQRDGGDCELLEVDGDIVRVRLTGACVLCRLSATTLDGIQARVVERLGAFVRLVPVLGRGVEPH
ncbi:NifU family protein [Nitrospirillum sp. BR 11163]|uniref:NifU family protein n=1 Tax=Nitrospirillum sp. BR 11163 TaxID=3104323 RepID=UPI002AFE4BC8|nr:NifU family protein [Nitrospirillum sp. BR 11163]MEA1675910.1 NifU family protein [Nitrospirillum sp. BR 11163]